MTKEEKKQWILKYMEEHKDEFIDITAENFILAYVDKFNPKLIEWYPYGSPKVHEIGKLLAECTRKIRLVDIDIIVKYGKMDIRDGFISII